jgi:hypothetical protein
MATTEMVLNCECGGPLRVLDRSGHSLTATCLVCRHASLIIEPPRFPACIHLCDFHLKRGDVPQGRPYDDLVMATKLYEDLVFDRWPSSATELDFGIDSSDHLGALQFAVQSGVTPYDLDRVIADGPAITQLVHSVPVQPYPVVFKTIWDGIDWIEYDE